MSYRRIGKLALGFAFLFMATGLSAQLVIAPAHAPVVLGQWHNSFEKTRAVAFANDIPLLAVWGDTRCSFCDRLDAHMALPAFRTWQAERQIVMLYSKNRTTPNDNQVWDWTKNETLQWPYILVYWKGQTWRFTARYSTVEQFIAKVESYISAYVSRPLEPPATDARDPGDDLRAGATLLPMLVGHGQSKPHYLNKADHSDWFRFSQVQTGKQYRVWITDLQIQGATNLMARFYRGNELDPMADPIPLTNLAAQAFQLDATDTRDLMLGISRDASSSATVGYTVNYREWVPSALSFETNAVRISEAAGALLVPVRRAVWSGATSATLRFRNGTATAGQDYAGAPITLNWAAGGADVQTARVTIVNDRIWEGDETFFIDLEPDLGSSLLGAHATLTVTLTESSAPTPGALGYTAYTVNGTRLPLTSATRIPAREGQPLTLWVARAGGDSLPASAVFAWSDGSTPPAPLQWASLEAGEKGREIVVPVQPGYQPPRSLQISFTAVNAAGASGRTSASLTVTDEDYIEPLSAYVARNPAIPFRTTQEAWFMTHGNVLRCAPPTATGAATLTASLRGPGVLAFTGQVGSGAGQFTVQVGSQAARATLTDGSEQRIAIPPGAQTVTWRFARGAGSTDQSFASIANPRYLAVSAAVALAPAAGSVARAGPLNLRWSDSLAVLRGLAGVELSYRVLVGPTARSLEQVGAEINAGAGAADPVNVRQIAAGAGPLVWRVDMRINDGAQVVEAPGTPSSLTIVDGNAAAFDVSESDLEDQGWFSALLDGSTLQVRLQTGVQTRVGPLRLSGVSGEPAARLGGGALPPGMRVSVVSNAVWLTGIPSRPGSGTAIVQATSVMGRTVAPGTTLAIMYDVAPLPAEMLGAYVGETVRHDTASQPAITDLGVWEMVENDLLAPCGLASLSVANTGRISGRFQFADRSYTFTANGFDRMTNTQQGVVFQASEGLNAVSGAIRAPIRLTVSAGWPAQAWVEPVDAEQQPWIMAALGRNGWQARPLDEDRQAIIAASAGYYTVILPNSDAGDPDDVFGTGYLAVTVAANGAVRAAGRLADGTSVSMSGTLLLDATGQPYTVLFTAPRAYQGGYLFVRMAFNLDVIEAVTLTGYAVWINKHPQATGELGVGFARLLEVRGGFYDRTENLQALFNGNETFEAWAASSWEDGVAQLGLNATATAFVVPQGGTVGNPQHLTISANRATGLFNGTFREPTGVLAFLTRSYWGILTPILPPGVETFTLAGRGFYLKPQQASTPGSGYSFNVSGDFLIATDCDGCGE